MNNPARWNQGRQADTKPRRSVAAQRVSRAPAVGSARGAAWDAEHMERAAPIYSLGISTLEVSPHSGSASADPTALQELVKPALEPPLGCLQVGRILRSRSPRVRPGNLMRGVLLGRGCPSARGIRLAGRTPAPARPIRVRDERAYLVWTEWRAVENGREVLPQCAFDGARLAPARQGEEHAQEFEVLGTVEAEVEAPVIRSVRTYRTHRTRGPSTGRYLQACFARWQPKR